MESALSVITHRGTSCAVLLADLRGKVVRGRVDAESAARITQEIDLREDAVLLDYDRFEAGERQWATRLRFNETMLAPKAIEASDEYVDLLLGTSRYSAFRAAVDQWSVVPEDDRITAMLRDPLATPVAFTHTLGVNVTLVTADAMLISTRRSSSTGLGQGLMSVAMSEASNADDADRDGYDPLITAYRGLHEELGLLRSDLTSVRFHSLIASVADGGISVLGHASTMLTANEVFERQRSAADADEADGMHLQPFSPEGFAAALDEAWVSWGPPAMLGTARMVFGDEVADELERRSGAPVAV